MAEPHLLPPDWLWPEMLRETRRAERDGIGFARLRRWQEAAAAFTAALEELERLAPNAESARRIAAVQYLLARVHRENRSRAAALAAAQDSARRYRELANGDASAAGLEMARSLENFAAALADVNRPLEAIAQAEEAVRICRRPDADPEVPPVLAAALNTLATILLRAGRAADARALAEESVEIGKRLSRQQPDRFLAGLGRSIATWNAAARSGVPLEEVAARLGEKVREVRELARQHPDEFLHLLADSAARLALFLVERGRDGEALPYVEEAAAIYTHRARRDAAATDWAKSMRTAAHLWRVLGRREQALPLCQEVVREYRAWADASSVALLHKLARSLEETASLLSEMGRAEEALGYVEEEVIVYRREAALDPESAARGLARTLNDLAVRLNEIGRRGEALERNREAIALYRAFPRPRAAFFLSGSLAIRARILGREAAAEALECYAEAVRCLTGEFLQAPQHFAPQMRSLCMEYSAAARAAGVAPDRALLERVLPALGIVQTIGPA